MFGKILAVIDRSTANQKVFEEALSLAKVTSSKLILLHVLSGEEEGSPILSHYATFYPTVGDHYTHLSPRISHAANQLYQRQWKAFEADGLQMLRSFTDRALAAGVPTEFHQITGHPSSAICDFAQSCHAEAIVLENFLLLKTKKILRSN